MGDGGTPAAHWRRASWPGRCTEVARSPGSLPGTHYEPHIPLRATPSPVLAPLSLLCGGAPCGQGLREGKHSPPPQDPLAAPRQNGGGGPSLSRAPSLLRPLRGPLARCFQQKVLPARSGSAGDSSPVTPQLPPSQSAGPLAWHPGRLVSAAAAGRGPRAAAGQMAAWPAAPGRHCPHRCDASCHPSARDLAGQAGHQGLGTGGRAGGHLGAAWDSASLRPEGLAQTWSQQGPRPLSGPSLL